MLILGPNCHCFCVHSGSVSGSLVAVQSLSVSRSSPLCGDSQACSVPCSWGAAAFLAPGRMADPGLLPPWALAVFAAVCVPARVCLQGLGVQSVSHTVLCSPGTAVERVPACLHKAGLQPLAWHPQLGCGMWISSPALPCACQPWAVAVPCTVAAGCLQDCPCAL